MIRDEWRYIYKVRVLLVHFESTQSMMMMANSIRNAHNAHTRIAGVMQSHIWNWNWWGWTTTTKTTKIGKKWEKLVNAFARWEWKSAPPIKQQGRDDPEGGGEPIRFDLCCIRLVICVWCLPYLPPPIYAFGQLFNDEQTMLRLCAKRWRLENK